MHPVANGSLPASRSIVLTLTAATAAAGIIVLAYSWSRKKLAWVKDVARIEKLIFYPIKSLSGIPVDRLQVNKNGVTYGKFKDRCLLLLNHENRMITLRHAPQLALIKTSIDADGSGVTVSAEGMPDITITPKAKVENSDQIVSFTIWSQATEGVVVGQGSSEWFSKYLGQEVRLVQHMPDFRMRGTEVETKGGKIFDKSIPIMYHDSGPVYLINDATIESANSLCQEPEFSWESFRPNIVVKGAAADAEESWSHVRINRITFKNVYISDKCAVTTVDKERGIKVDSRMDLLRKRRSATTDYERKNFGDKALFGISLAPHSRGLIEAGMTIDASMKS